MSENVRDQDKSIEIQTLGVDPSSLTLPSRSEFVPDDVNCIRPSDVDIIAAMGDSFSCGTRSINFSDDPYGDYYENNFITGGNGDMSKHLTIANILREMNPNLIGFSTKEDTGCNVAVGGVTSEALPEQAEKLIEKIKIHDPTLNERVKLITIFVGANDIGKLGGYLKTNPVSVKNFKSNIRKALRVLSSLGRCIVMLIPVMPAQMSSDARCIIERGRRLGDRKRVLECDELISSYQKAVYDIQNCQEFDTTTFTVVVQGFWDKHRYPVHFPGLSDGVRQFYGDDLFHWSKYGNAAVARCLWNCMLEPVGQKNQRSYIGNDEVPLEMPTEECPYIRTIQNSRLDFLPGAPGSSADL